MFIRLATCVLLLGCNCGSALSSDSVQIIKDCKLHQSKSTYTNDEIYGVIACDRYMNGFISGAMGSQNAKQMSGEDQKGLICYPNELTTGQAIAVFIEWSERNPKFWHRQEWENMYASQYGAFPCK